jgi:peptide-methionine (S)-S-oxide reductase
MVAVVLLAARGTRKEERSPVSLHREKGGTVQKATFAAGCFWGVEETFRHVEGVIDTEVGYTGGHTESPTYREVCSDKTGHAEAVEVHFDPEKVEYAELLDVFWKCHDHTTPNRQGPDVGSQYRSAIFYHTPEQQGAAEESKKRLEQSGAHNDPIATQIVPASRFWPAEEYHQRYVEKQGIKSCPL